MIRRGRPYLEYRTEPAGEATEQLEREGYTIVRGLLSPDEVAELAADVARGSTTPSPRTSAAARRPRTATCSAMRC